MKVTILMVVLWSMFAGHSYGQEVERAPKSPEESMTPEMILESLNPVTRGRLLSLMNGEEKLMQRTPTSLSIEEEARKRVYNKDRNPGKITRSPAVEPSSLQFYGHREK